MSSTRDGTAPLEVKLAAGRAVLTGCALLVLGIAQTALYLPVGVALFVGAYGLWTRELWGFVLVGLAFTSEGVRALAEGALVELAVVLALLTYLFLQRHQYATPRTFLVSE